MAGKYSQDPWHIQREVAAFAQERMRELEGLSPAEKRAALQQSLREKRAKSIAIQRENLAGFQALLAEALKDGDDDKVIAALKRLVKSTEKSLAESLEKQAAAEGTSDQE